jgi:hypothetical protein
MGSEHVHMPTDVETRLEELSRRNDEMAAELARLREASAATRPAPSVPAPAEDDETPLVSLDEDGGARLDRRRALGNLGKVAAASAGMLALGGALRPAPAAAEAFTSLIIAEDQGGAQHPTRLYSTAGNTSDPLLAAVFSGRNNGTATSTLHRIGLYGLATSKGTGVYGEARGGDTSVPSHGVYGTTDGEGAALGFFYNAGVLGTSTGPSAVGVRGSAASYGVVGTSSSGIGVYGEGGNSLQAGTGVRAHSDLGTPLRLSSNVGTVPPTSGSWSAGSFLVSGGHVWYCYESGTGSDSKWARLSSSFVPLAAGSRIYDSRPGQPPSYGDQGSMSKGDERVLDVTVTGEVPDTASAVLLNATVVGVAGGCYLVLYKDGESAPDTANVNYASGAVVGNNATVGLAAGKLRALIDGGPDHNEAHVILDVLGYYL